MTRSVRRGSTSTRLAPTPVIVDWAHGTVWHTTPVEGIQLLSVASMASAIPESSIWRLYASAVSILKMFLPTPLPFTSRSPSPSSTHTLRWLHRSIVLFAKCTSSVSTPQYLE